MSLATLPSTTFQTKESPLWMKLGTQIPEGVKTWHDAIIAAGLDWTVSMLTPKFERNGFYYDIPNSRAIVRDDTNLALGMVGPYYKPMQNQSAFDFVDTLVMTEDAKYVAGGSTRNGAYVYMMAKINKLIEIPDVDEELDVYLTLSNSFNGKASLSIGITPVRGKVSLQTAIRGALRSWITSHRGDYTAKMKEAQKTLGLTLTYLDEFESMARDLASASWGTTEMQELGRRLFPIDYDEDTDRIIANKEEQIDALISLYNMSAGLDNVRDTAWGAYVAASEYSDFGRRTRSSKHGSAEENQLHRTLNDHTLKDKAFTEIQDMVSP